MLSFKQFLRESNFDLPHSEPILTHSGTQTLFPPSLGYSRSLSSAEYNPKHSAMIHVTKQFPVGGVLKTLGNYSSVPRETLHFTRNGIVSSHAMGNFENRKFGVMLPESGISHRLLNHGSHDSFVVGNVQLPHNSRLLVNWGSLEDHEKDHIAALTGSGNHDEAQEKIQNGHAVNFGTAKSPRVMYIHSLGKDENMTDGLHRHIRSLGINPVGIGSNYATGFEDKPKESEMSHIPKRDVFSHAEHYFKHLYGPGGKIQTAYDRMKSRIGRADTKVPQLDMDDFKSKVSFAAGSAGAHSDTPLSGIEHIYSNSTMAGGGFYGNTTVEQQLKGLKSSKEMVDHILSSPPDLHNAYRHPEAVAGIQRIKKKIDSGIAGVSRGQYVYPARDYNVIDHPEIIAMERKEDDKRKEELVAATKAMRSN